MNSIVNALVITIAVTAGSIVMCGCEEEPVTPQPPTPTAQGTVQPPAAPPNQDAVQVTQGGGSALGGAKRSATGLADQVDQQQRDLLREMGEEPPPPAGDD